MVSFLDALGQTANFLNNDPSFQREEMYYRGIDPRIVEPQIERMVAGQQERQAAEAEIQRKQSLAQQIMERGAELTPQEIMAIGAQDAELGKLAAKVFLDGQKMTAQQQKAQALIAQGYDEKTANDLSLGVIKDSIDERGRPIRINMADGTILPVGGSPAMSNAQPTYQPFGDETLIGGVAPDIDSNIGTSDIPSIDGVAAEMGLDLTNPTDAKTAERIFKSRMAGNETTGEQSKNRNKTSTLAGELNMVENSIDTALSQLSEDSILSPRAGFLGSIAANIPQTGAYDFAETLQTIESNLGFDKLQQMRDMSPTGGALGQVAVQELQALQKSVVSLKQSQTKAQLGKNLLILKERYKNSQEKLKKAYIKDFGTDKGFDEFFIKNKPNTQQPQGQSQSYNEGTVAEDGNGNRIILRNGAWEAM